MASYTDLNADLGEEVTDDAALLAVVTSANVACGFHAGTDAIMRRVCDLAVARGVAIGAQVSYSDREGFGRRRTEVAYEVLRDQVAEQVATLEQHAAAAGGRVAYVKPHGALYNRVVDDEEQARAVVDGSAGLPLLSLPGSALGRLATGRLIFAEGFPDRGYTPEGRLVPRDQPGAFLTGADVPRRALELARSVDSVCIHGDSPGAVGVARAVRRALTEAGYALRPFTAGSAS